jgi:hypothetical protein
MYVVDVDTSSLVMEACCAELSRNGSEWQRPIRRGRGTGNDGGGQGFGRRLGWFGVGYGDAPDAAGLRAQSLRDSLERRAAYLRAELERTESLLKNRPEGSPAAGKQLT